MTFDNDCIGVYVVKVCEIRLPELVLMQTHGDYDAEGQDESHDVASDLAEQQDIGERHRRTDL